MFAELPALAPTTFSFKRKAAILVQGGFFFFLVTDFEVSWVFSSPCTSLPPTSAAITITSNKQDFYTHNVASIFNVMFTRGVYFTAVCFRASPLACFLAASCWSAAHNAMHYANQHKSVHYLMF